MAKAEKIVSLDAHLLQRATRADATVLVPQDVIAFRSANIEVVGFAYLPGVAQRISELILGSRMEHLQRKFQGDLDIMFTGDKFESLSIGFDADIDVQRLKAELIKLGFETVIINATPEMIETFAQTEIRSSLSTLAAA